MFYIATTSKLQKQQTITDNNHNKTITSYLQVKLTKLQLQGEREIVSDHIAEPDA